MGNLLASGFDWSGSGREFKRALELNPDALDSLLDYSYFYLGPMRRLDEAVSNLQKAADLDPMSAIVQVQLGRNYYLKGQYGHSIKQLLSVLELDPNYWLAHMWLALSYLETGQQDKAIQTAETSTQVPHIPLAVSFLGYVYATCGRIRESQKVLNELKEYARNTYIPSLSFASIYIPLGEIDKGIECLEESFEERHSFLFHFTLPPFFNSLRSHPATNPSFGK
jgi:tetratricopeptide (TPR) repeat protein